jgi:hypothetical protein
LIDDYGITCRWLIARIKGAVLSESFASDDPFHPASAANGRFLPGSSIGRGCG